MKACFQALISERIKCTKNCTLGIILWIHGSLMLQSSSLNEDVDDISSSESLSAGGGAAPSGAGASGFLKRVLQQNVIMLLNISTTMW